MNITDADRLRLSDLFQRAGTKEDLLSLLNEAKSLLYGKKTHPFKMQQITWFTIPDTNKRRYAQFTIKKSSGGERVINAPVKGLKAIQKCLNLIFQCVFESHKKAFGFTRNKSIVENAQLHAGSNYVYNVDLKDFFPSVDQARIWKCLQLRPFNLKGVDRIQLANIIAVLCCTELEVERLDETGKWQTVKKNVLPQGAPTSPILTNVVCFRLDVLLTGLAKRFGLKYSRYADDITFSSMHNVYQEGSDFITELNRIISEQGFTVNQSKVRLQKQGYRQEVTGLVVNKVPNVRKQYIKELRMWLYLWEQYGFNRCNHFYNKRFNIEESAPSNFLSPMVLSIAGKINFVRQVKGSSNLAYINLYKRFRNLIEVTNGKAEEVDRLNRTLEIFESDGIEAAMNYYIPNPL